MPKRKLASSIKEHKDERWEGKKIIIWLRKTYAKNRSECIENDTFETIDQQHG